MTRSSFCDCNQGRLLCHCRPNAAQERANRRIGLVSFWIAAICGALVGGWLGSFIS